MIIKLLAVAALAVWSAGVAASRLGLKDPGQVVVDEVAGYLVAVAFLPASWSTLALGFLFFRLFDITKPPPCRRAEALPGGFGIVADDLVAGLYANLAIRLLTGAGNPCRSISDSFTSCAFGMGISLHLRSFA